MSTDLLPPAFHRSVLDVVGSARFVDDAERTAPQSTDWTGRFVGRAAAVVRPDSVEEVAAIVATARSHGVALVPQGGNTGLVGGATPMDGEVVVDLRRLASIDDVDAVGGQLTAGAGTAIEQIQQAASDIGWSYGVDWAARATATLGGSVATDAGGVRFVRHGSTRRQLLGIEAVLGNGTVIGHLPRVEKDNTGYDLAALLCGSEGTLGLITRVRVRLVSPRGPAAVALIGFRTMSDAVGAASRLRRELVGLEAVELMLASGVALVVDAFDLPSPFPSPPPVVLLVETAGDDAAGALAAATEGLPGVLDAAVATEARRRARLWRYREDHTLAIARLGAPHKFDVTLPADALADFVEQVPALVASVAPAANTWLFGHAADGNIHVNVTGLAPDDEAVADAVLTDVAGRGGSISAEHGIGRAKQRWLHLARGPGDRAVMAEVKRALDPDGICNPGVLLGR